MSANCYNRHQTEILLFSCHLPTMRFSCGVKLLTEILHCVNGVGSDVTHIYIINIYRFPNYIGRRAA